MKKLLAPVHFVLWIVMQFAALALFLFSVVLIVIDWEDDKKALEEKDSGV